MNVFNIERTFSDKTKRRWQKIFIAVDVHDVILTGTYTPMNDGAKYMPNAIKVLQQWSKREDISLILWTSGHIGPTSKVLDTLEKQGVSFKHVNCNPECPNDALCDFSKKFYFNILLDDKAGMDAAGGDWFLIENELKRIGEWVE
jgi:hypothetical protein